MSVVLRRASRGFVVLWLLGLLSLLLPALPARAAPVLTVAPNGVTATDPAPGGNANGLAEPGEIIQLTVNLSNAGDPATMISGTLSTTTPGVTLVTPTANYPDIAMGGTGANTAPFVFRLDPTFNCGAPIAFSLSVTFAGGGPTTLTFSVNTGQPGGGVTTSYTGPSVAIPDSGGNDIPGVAANASLVVMQAGRVGKVVFQFDGTMCSATAGSTTVGLSHTFVNDLQITLISPSGTEVNIINRTDGGGNNFCQTVLDDDSVGPSIQTAISANAPFTGSWKPNSPLAAFNGEPISGTWILRVQDFFIGDVGNIRAWSLRIQPATCAAPPPAPTTTTVSGSPNPSVVGQSVALTATVAPTFGGGTPTGTATFTDTTNPGSPVSLGAPVALVGGMAALNTAALPVGARTITATYSGDASFATGNGTFMQAVNKGNTTTSFAGAPNPSGAGQSVTLTATIAATAPAAGTPTGSVTFTSGMTTLGMGTLNGMGVATLATTALPVGTSTITATYGGDATFNGSVGMVSETVNKGNTTTGVVAAPNPATVGTSVTLTATVGAVAPASGTRTGSVTFTSGMTTLGTGTVNAMGVATLSTTALPVGMNAITATYSGDATFNGSSGTTTATVTAATLTALSATAPTGGANRGTATMPQIVAGAALPLAVTGSYNNGATGQPVSGATFASSNPNVATVDANGRVTGLSTGTTTITVSMGGVTTTITVTVAAPGTGGLNPNPAPAPRPAQPAGAAGGTTPTPNPLPPQR